MISVPYEKWDATGNDFVVIDLSLSPIERGSFTPDLVREMCDRKHGVGADGVVLLDCAEGEQPHHVAIWNSDGSSAEMCGNALRCVAVLLAGPAQVRIGSRTVGTRSDEPEYSHVAMGPAAAQDGHAMFASLPGLDEVLGGKGYLLSFGNPHYIIPLFRIPEDWARRGAQAQALGHQLLGTNGINCGFLQTEPDAHGHYPLCVFERGVGVTQSCGSGACAASAVLERVLGVTPPHRLQVLGGQLEIGRESNGGFELGGPARREFTGQWRLG